MAELPPPPNRKGGWYPDPEGSGRLRWWGGKKWGDRYMDAPGGEAKPSTPSPAEASAGGPAGPSSSGDAPEPKKQRGRWLGAPWWAWLIGAFVVLVIVSAIAGGSDSSNDNGSNNTAQATKTVTQARTVTQAAPAQPAPAPTTTAAPAPQEADLTSGQENALKAAQDYIDLSGFSRAGLIGQLSSSAGEGFSRADATYAADHVDADWNAEAVEAAQQYLDLGGFSKSGLIQQLSSSAGDQFTRAQAEYAANQVYGR